MGLGIWIALLIALVAAIWDVVKRKIPNFLTLGGVLLGFALHATIGFADGGASGAGKMVVRALVGLGLCAILPVIGFARRQLGGGDVKLFAAIGALTGPIVGFDAQAAAFVVIAAIVFPYRLWRDGALRANVDRIRIFLTNLGRPKAERLPPTPPRKLGSVVLGPAILGGLCLAAARHWPLLLG